jgi:glutamate formiminotransferase/formiminotetrahydrofolate cyclodeaminase
VPSAGEADAETLSEAARRAQTVKDRLLLAVDEDTAAFGTIIEARRMSRGTEAEKAARQAAILQANKTATDVPMAVLQLCVDAIRLSGSMVESGLVTAVSDAGTGAHVGLAGAEGAYLNVRINLKSIEGEDAAWARSTRRRADDLLEEARAAARKTWPLIEARIDG